MKKTLVFICILLIALVTLGSQTYAYSTKEPIELIELRTVNQKVFLLPDGTYEFNYYNTPIHYWNGKRFEEFNNSFSSDNHRFFTENTNYSAALPKLLSSRSIVNLSYMGLYSLDIAFDNQLTDSFLDTRKSTSSSSEISEIYNYVSNLSGIVNYQSENGLISYEQSAEGFNHFYEIKKVVDSFETKFTIYTEDLILLNNDEYTNVLVTKQGIPIYQIGNQYLFDSNGKSISDSSLEVVEVENGYEVYVNYDLRLENLNLEYPLTSVNAIINYMNSGPSYIRDKYVIVGESSSYDNNSLYAGTDPLGYLFDPDMDPIHNTYRTFLELSLPDVDSSDVISAEFNINKSMTNPNPLFNPTIYLRRVTNKTYDQLTGTTSYLATNIATGASGQTSYSFDITNAVKNQLDVSNELVLAITGEPVYGYTTGNAVFYATNQGGSLIPSFSVVLEDPVLGLTPYGSAEPYTPMSGWWFNCFSYAVGYYDDWLEPYDNGYPYSYPANQYYYETVYIPYAMSTMGAYNIAVRIINNILSPVYPYERRIAYRIGNFNTGYFSDFHFMKQHNDGSWSHKPGQTPTILLGTGLTPNDVSWGIYNYNSPITYFAIYPI